MAISVINRKTSVLLIIPSLIALSGCESSGSTRISGVGADSSQVAQGAQGERGEQGIAGPAGPAGPAGANGTNGINGTGSLGLGSAGALAVGGLVGPGGIAGTGLLASTGDINNTNPVISGVLVKSGGLVNVVADQGLKIASVLDSKIPGGTNLVGTVVGVVKSTGVALVQTGNGQQYLLDGLAAAPGQLITATIGQATAIGSPTASPLIGASILSPGQKSGSLATVGVGSNGQLITLQPGGASGGILGGTPVTGALPIATLTNTVSSIVGSVTNAGPNPDGLAPTITGVVSSVTNAGSGTSAGGKAGNVVTGVTGTVGGLLGGLKPKGKAN